MKNTTRKLGSIALLIALSILTIDPALAEHRRDYNKGRHHNSQQPFSQSYYNRQYQNYQARRYGHHQQRSRDHGYANGYGYRYGNHYNKNHHYNNNHAGYSSYNNRHNGYRADQHRHRHGIVILRRPAYGYSHCEAHGGYYRDGDIYY